MTEPRGEVFDLGYQHYKGPREGRMRARKALWMNGVRTALGLGRGSRAKILPVLFFVVAMIPALIMALGASESGPGGDVPGHSDYYWMVSIILFLFAAIIAPELLCPDRRNGVINLYLVRPLTPTDYVVGRWLALFSITLAIVYLGQVVLLVGLTLGAAEPLDYLRDHWLDIPRFLGAGLVVALFFTTLPMAVSAFTTRRAYATAFVIGLFLISFAVAGALTEYTMPTANASNNGPVCNGSDVKLIGGPDGMTSYAWSGPSGFTSATQNATVSPAVAGTYTLNATDSDGCWGTDTTIVSLCDQDITESPEPGGGAVVQCEPVAGDAAKWFTLINIGAVPIYVNDLIFAEENESEDVDELVKLVRELPAGVPIGWYLLLTVGSGFALWWRYRRIGT
ncbi:MAG: ABC transporter permease subunit [Dehalococcoidia bacterium]|nr:ABC transporter permease subunit [Dehalococcoidia bacterium]